MRPYLCQVERVVAVCACLVFGHNLEIKRPSREVSSLDGFEEVAYTAVGIFAPEHFCLFLCNILDTLLGDKVEFHPYTPPVAVDEAVGMATETVHVAERCRYAPVRHVDRDLMERFGQHRPEVPLVLFGPQVGLRVALYGVVQVWEEQRVAKEEHGSIVAHKVPVALVCVEFEGKSADVSFGVCRSAFTGCGREARKHLCLLANGREYRCTCVLCHVVCHGKLAVCSSALCMHAPFGNHLAVEVCNLLHIPYVLHGHRSAWSCCLRISVVGYRGAHFVGQFLAFLFHSLLFLFLSNEYLDVVVFFLFSFH